MPKKIRVTRDGDRDIVFTGGLIGEGNYGTGGNSGYQCDWTRGTIVKIYSTVGGKYIVHVEKWSRWQGEGNHDRAVVCNTGDEVLAWLTDDCGGVLGAASKAAWEEACENVTALEGQDVEVVA